MARPSNSGRKIDVFWTRTCGVGFVEIVQSERGEALAQHARVREFALGVHDTEVTVRRGAAFEQLRDDLFPPRLSFRRTNMY